MPSKAEDRGMTPDQLVELMTLVKGAKSVELKLTVPADSARQTFGALSASIRIDGEIRLVTFFDTPDLALNKAGVVVRPAGSRATARTPW